jgi:hypothetical protein
VIRGTNVMPADPRGQELLDPSMGPPVGPAAPLTDGAAAGTRPPSADGARASPIESDVGAPMASAVSGSQNTVTTPSTVSKINVPVTIDEVRSQVRSGARADGGLAFGVAAIGGSIDTS